MSDVTKILILLALGHCLIDAILAIILLIRSYRIEAKNLTYHATKDKD